METRDLTRALVRSFPIVPPSGGSLEIGNATKEVEYPDRLILVPPSGGSLEIGNTMDWTSACGGASVPPSGGSLEIGNGRLVIFLYNVVEGLFPLRGDP